MKTSVIEVRDMLSDIGIQIGDQQFTAMQTICGKAMPATFNDYLSKTRVTNTASVLRRSITPRAPIKEFAQIIQPGSVSLMRTRLWLTH